MGSRTRNRMIIQLVDVHDEHYSDAVAAAKVILGSLRGADRIVIENSDLAEDQWEEMRQYLERRGVVMFHDHDDGFPVAEMS